MTFSFTLVRLRETSKQTIRPNYARHLASGQKLDAQLVLAGIGIVPDTALAEAAGLAVDNGIVTDADYLTSDPHISAIGDVAWAPTINPFRVESIYHAQYSGAVAARLTAMLLRPMKLGGSGINMM